MKKNILFLTIAILLYECGGVIGNIEKYPFHGVTRDSLIAALNRVYIKYPELQKSDTSIYGTNDGKEFYFIIENDNKKFVFDCHIIVNTPYDIDLSLTTATTWGMYWILHRTFLSLKKESTKNCSKNLFYRK